MKTNDPKLKLRHELFTTLMMVLAASLSLMQSGHGTEPGSEPKTRDHVMIMWLLCDVHVILSHVIIIMCYWIMLYDIESCDSHMSSSIQNVFKWHTFSMRHIICLSDSVKCYVCPTSSALQQVLAIVSHTKLEKIMTPEYMYHLNLCLPKLIMHS